MHVSPDNRHVYVGTFHSNTVVAFARDTSTGQLTHIQTLEQGVDGVNGLLERLNRHTILEPVVEAFVEFLEHVHQALQCWHLSLIGLRTQQVEFTGHELRVAI